MANNKSTKLNQRISQMKADSQKKKKQFEQIVSNAKRENERISASTRQAGQKITTYMSSPSVKRGGVTYLKEPTSIREKFFGDTDKSWYTGKTPTQSQTVARMYTVANGDEQKFRELEAKYNAEIRSAGSPIYAPYVEATNTKAINALTELGYDMSGGVTQKWLDDNKWLLQYGRQTTTGYGPSAPTKKSTALENAAYWYNVLLEDEEATVAAETEYNALADNVKYLVERGYSDDAILKKIKNESFGSTYRTLAKMDEERSLGSAVRLNRSVNYNGDDTIYGMIWAARNGGGSGDYFVDAVKYALGEGNKYVADPKSEAARDPSSPDYHPYYGGSTLHEINMRHGVTSYDDKWFVDNAWMKNGTQQERNDYLDALDAKDNADAAMRELSGEDSFGTLDGWVQRKVDSGMSADEIIDLFDAELNSGDYPTLAKMERMRQRGTYLPLAYEVNFTVPVYEQKIRDMVAERDQAAAAAEAEVKQQEENKQREREERVEAALAGGSAFLSGGMGADGPIDMGQPKQPEEEMLPEEEPSAEPEVTPEPTRPAYESSLAFKSVFGTTEEQPREGMADGEFVPQSGMDIGEPTPLSTSTGKMTADSEEGQAYLSMLNGGEWDSAVFSEALASSTNRAGMLDEVEQDILALRSGKPMDQVSGIARSWYNAHAHLLDYDIKGIDYSRNIGVVDDSLDIAQYYGDTLDEIIRLNAEAANVSAITPEKYIENLMQIADVTDIVDGIAARDGEGKEVAAQQVLENIPGQQETLDAIYDSCTEAIEANAAALEEANQQALQASIDAVKAYQAGTASEAQQMFMDNAMAMDSSAVAKNDAAYKEAEAYISNALSPDGLRGRGIMFTTGSAESDMAMDPEMLFNTGAQAYAQGVKGIADAKLQRDLKLATVCGMSLAEYYEAFPEEARTADQILAEAENEYKAAWQDEFGGTIKGLLEMNEAEDEAKEGLGLRESVFGMPAQKFDAMTAASMWKTIDLLFYKGLTGDEAMGAMYREYGGDRAAATASVTEYMESLPEEHQQRKELEAFLGSGADIFSLGKTTGQLKTEAGVINAEADLQTIEKFVSEHGTALEKSMVDITASSMNSIAQMGAAAVGVANGLPNWLASVLAAIPEGGSTGYDLNRQGASYGTSILAAFGQTLWTGLTESFMNTEYLNLGNSPIVQKAKKILGQYELSAMLHGDPGTGAKIMNFFLDAVAASPAEGAQEFFQSLGSSVIENIALNLNGLRKGFVLGKDDLSDAGQEFLMGMVTSLPLSGVGAGIESFTSVAPKLTDARGNLLSLAEAQLLPEYDGALVNSAIDSEVTREAIYEASADLQAIAGSNEQAAVAQAQEEAQAAMLEAEEAQQEADRLDAEMTARQQALESINQQMLETDEFNQDMHDQMTALAESILNDSTALTDAQVKAEEANRKADEAQQKVADAEAVVQEMYDRAMDDAKRRVRPRVVERMYAGVSEDAQTAEQAYLDACARLSDAKNELRSAKADLDVYQRGTARGQEARSAYNEAMKEVERLTEEVEAAKRAVDEAYAKTPEAQTEVMLEEDVSAAETAAQEAEAAAEADPDNLQTKAKAGIARAKATAEAALKNLENVRQKVQSMITSADRNVRAQAAADYQAAVQEAEAAQKAVDDAQSEYDSEYSAQGKLQKAIDNFKQYSNEDLLLEENENHEAAVKAYAELEQASLAVELENAYAKMDEAAASMDAADLGTVRAFKEAQEEVKAAESSVKENKYSYAALTSKPDIEVVELEDSGNMSRDDAVEAGQQNVRKYSDRADRNGALAMYVPDLGKHVIVGRKALRHGLDRRASGQIQVIPHIGDILRSSVVVNEATPKKKSMSNSYILLGAARLSDGTPVYVRMVVNQPTMEIEDISSLYSVYGKKNRTSRDLAAHGGPNGFGMPTGSAISITELLDAVKNDFSDVLSDDVVNQLGITRKPTEITPDLRYSRGDGWKDHRTPGKNGATTTADKNPIEILSDLTRSIRAGYNPGGTMGVGSRRLPRAVMAFYDNRANSITSRTNAAGDLATGLHEFGHAVQSRLSGLHANQQMIDALSDDVRNAYNRPEWDGEAVAEFVVDYMFSRDEAVRSAGQEFVEQFEEMLTSDRALYDAVMEASHQIELWNNSDVGSRIGATVKDSADPNRRQIGNWLSRTLRKIETAIFDVTAPADLVSRGFRKLALYTLQAGQRSDTVLTSRLIDPRTNRQIGLSLAERLYNAGVAERDMDALVRYALARHSLDRRAQNKDVFAESEFSTDELTRYVQDVEANSPNIVAGANAITEFWNDFVDAWLVNTGMISRETVENMRAMYPHYVPTFRVMDENYNQYGGQSSVFQLHGAVEGGSSLEVINPLVSIVDQVQKVVNTVTRNQLVNAFNAEMQRGGMGEIATSVPEAQIMQRNDIARAMAALQQIQTNSNADPDAVETLIDELNSLSERFIGTGRGAGTNTISGIDENGTRFFYDIHDKGLFDLLSGNTRAASAVPKLVSNFNRTFSALTTGSNPLFAIKNAQRDIQSSVNTGTWALTYADGVAKWIRAFGEVVTNSESFREWQAMGGGQHTRLSTALTDKEAGELTRSVGRMLLRGDTTAMRGRFKVRRTFGEATIQIMTMQDFNNAIENASRFAEWRFGKHDLSTAEGRTEAFMRSQDVTTNFGTHGAAAWVQNLGKCVPFMNATLQGLNKDINIVKDLFSSDEAVRAEAAPKAAKTVMNTALTAMLQYAILNFFGGEEDDEDYAMLSEDMKLGNLIIPIPETILKGMQDKTGFNKPYIRIPIAQGTMSRGLYAAALELVGNVADYGPMEIDLWNAAKSILADSLPDGTVFSAIQDAMNNRTWYGGEIESYYMQQRSEYNRYDEDTPQSLINLAQFFRTSPAKMEYMMNQYSGIVGKIVAPLISGSTWGERGKNLINSVLSNYMIDPVSTNNLTADYKYGKDVIAQTLNDAKSGYAMGQIAYSANPDAAYSAAKRMQQTYERYDKEIAEQWERYNAIASNTTMNDGEKARRMREIRRNYIDRLYEEANAQFDEFRLMYVDADALAMDWYYGVLNLVGLKERPSVN